MSAAPNAKPPVLVVEDDSAIREVLSELLESAGFRVEGAANGREALATLQRFQPRVILLDLMMPVMNGWEFRAEQRRDPQLSRIPVVVLSADHALERKVSTLHADAWLAKPFCVDELIETIHRYAA